MFGRRIAVLKFGASVLQIPADGARVAQEIYRWRRKGYQVVAVVSAVGNTTDRLTQKANAFDVETDPRKFAALLSTGELQSAALTGLALDRAGLTSIACDEVTLGIRVTGDPLNADPVALDAPALREKLDRFGVVVVPGFIGRDDEGRVCLLGRGGSDLTALFVAQQLEADVCRLIKDVAGLYEFDPKTRADRHPRRYARIRFADALTLDESIVQHKGVRFAQQAGRTFEVGAIFSDKCTVVGSFADSQFAPELPGERRLRVAILGLGTVGLGVWHWLGQSLPNDVEIVSVAVRNRDAALRAGVPETILTDDPFVAVEADSDVVVELIGGRDLPRALIARALINGRHVVTANKSLLAQDIADLRDLANQHGVTIASSASVGGAVPVLETIRELQEGGHQIVGVRGVLNGTTNYVLDRIAAGESLGEAVELARQDGLAEADPRFDLEGRDAAEKLVLIARASGVELKVDDVVCQPLNELTLASLAAAAAGQEGSLIRQVVSWSPRNPQTSACVRLEPVSVADALFHVAGASNLLHLTLESGEVITVKGTGAGRWPTTTAVVSDLIDLAALIRRSDAEKGVECDQVVTA
jgi:homoserine dehydrogenase